MNRKETALEYSVVDWSSYSGDFTPLHVLEDKPSDQKSRWLSDGTQSPQFIVLKLTRPAVINSIKFGKYERGHQCNIRKLKVYGGMQEDKMHLLLDGGLEDNSEPEILSLKHCIEGAAFPCLFIKIMPLESWGKGFNFSIWYIQLFGESDDSVVSQAISSYSQYRERAALRLCLKHLRENDYTEAFEAVQKKARVDLEHPLLTQLHSELVVKGNFQECERMVRKSLEGFDYSRPHITEHLLTPLHTTDGLLDSYLEGQSLDSVWSEVRPTSGGDGWPSMRGAHQLCFEEENQILYLHGGWDGNKELGDLWTYSVSQGQWNCISQDCSLEGGPSPRSCHNMCLDEATRTLFFLGQYVKISPHDSAAPQSDFYCYQIDRDEWTKLSSDTASDGGPKLVFNHQMSFNVANRSLYVFGGRVLTPTSLGEGIYSGLYVYLVSRQEWACLQADFHPSTNYPYSLVPRMDHSMFINPSHNSLYVVGGERRNHALGDMIEYNVVSDETTVLADGRNKHIPEYGLAIRTCFDHERQEFLLLTNLSRFQDSTDHSLPFPKSLSQLPMWLYNIHTDKWLSVKQHGAGPCPRFAHQVAYDVKTKTIYMFGGHPGDSGKAHHTSMRLDDLWTMKLVRQDRGSLLRQCQLLIRQQRFNELSEEEPAQAVGYLQNDISAVINHDNPAEREQFQKMTAQLFSSAPKPGQDSVNVQRNEVYSKICSMFPTSMTQPIQNISDLLDIVPH